MGFLSQEAEVDSDIKLPKLETMPDVAACNASVNLAPNLSHKMGFKFAVVDAFSRVPFKGNPAAVVLLDEQQPLSEELMWGFAAEMNLNATAYLTRIGGGRWKIRYLTPLGELKICGHGTMAAARVLFDGEEAASAQLTFECLLGAVHVTRRDDLLVMDFPCEPPQAYDDVSPGLAESLGLKESEVVAVERNNIDYFVQVINEDVVKNLTPNFAALKKLKEANRVLAVTAQGTTHDIASRVFAPVCCADEDPVCGSAHCGLGPFWSKRLGKTRLSSCQHSPRAGELVVEVKGDRVFLEGHAVVVTRGEYVGPIF